MLEMNRREFVGAAAALCAACILCPSDVSFAAGNVGTIDAGPIANFASDGINDQFARSGRFLLIRRDGRMYATTTVCTHKQAAAVGVNSQNPAQLRCTKHGSLFALDGTVAKGPAKSPLPRCAIRLSAENHVIVDPSRQFSQKDWDNPDAFIKVG